MAKPDLGTKRVCPDTGRKFYDLNKNSCDFAVYRQSCTDRSAGTSARAG